MRRFNIIRKQLTPPGQDKIVATVEIDSDDLDVRKARLTEVLSEHAQREADGREDVASISHNVKPLRFTLIGQPAGTGNKYSPSSCMVEYAAEPDRDQAVPLPEAVGAIADMIGFGSKNGSHLRADNITMSDDGIINLTVAREHNFVAGRPQRFKITIEAIED